MTSSKRIDVHHHFIPQKFKAVLQEQGNREWPAVEWTASGSEAINEKLGTSTAILSLSSPSVAVATSLSEQLAIARDANEEGAKVRDANASQFGFFATIPDPTLFPDEALAELRRAFDDLHADGLCLMTQYSGKYLGHSAYDALWSELNRREAVVFIHPTSPANHTLVRPSLLPPVVDFTFETTKTACDLIHGMVIKRNPAVKIILSHGGGTLPWSWHRVAGLPQSISRIDMDFDTFKEQAQSFYFDTALTGYSENIELLLRFAKDGHVLFGSDFPYAPHNAIFGTAKGVDGVLNQEGKGDVKEGVNWRNALKLFPRLKQYHGKL